MDTKKLLNLFIAMTCLLHCLAANAATSAQKLSANAIKSTQQQVQYDGRYFRIPYPNGDIPSHLGVCTDVIIRTYRTLGIDLQERVHMDMRSNFDVYPSRRLWGLRKTDTNIDHRRVPNLQVFFSRHGKTLPASNHASDFKPGDLVTWMLPGNLPHIGIVTHIKHPNTGNPMIVHNIGAGPKLEDMLFNYTITGHYHYLP